MNAPVLNLHHDGLSRPLENPRLRVLSLGAGVQSSTLALMAARGDLGPMPDCAIFADTGAEPAAVYRHLEWLKSALPFPVHTVSAGNLRDQLLDPAAPKNGRPPMFVKSVTPAGTVVEVPGDTWLDGDGGEVVEVRYHTMTRDEVSVGMTNRQCTQDFKLIPIMREVRRLAGIKPKTRGPQKPIVEQWIGISTDEVVRLKSSRHRWSHNRHPLIEARMSRQDCLRWLEERQYPRPPKSACTFCPYHSNAMWRDMRDNDPESWADACRVDAALRENGLLLKGTPYLHRSCVPLWEVDLDEPDAPMFGFANECEGMCGV